MLDFQGIEGLSQGSSSLETSPSTSTARFLQEGENLHSLLLNCIHVHSDHCPANKSLTGFGFIHSCFWPSTQSRKLQHQWTYHLSSSGLEKYHNIYQHWCISLLQTVCSLKYKGFFSIPFACRHVLFPQMKISKLEISFTCQWVRLWHSCKLDANREGTSCGWTALHDTE